MACTLLEKKYLLIKAYGWGKLRFIPAFGSRRFAD